MDSIQVEPGNISFQFTVQLNQRTEMMGIDELCFNELEGCFSNRIIVWNPFILMVHLVSYIHDFIDRFSNSLSRRYEIAGSRSS